MKRARVKVVEIELRKHEGRLVPTGPGQVTKTFIVQSTTIDGLRAKALEQARSFFPRSKLSLSFGRAAGSDYTIIVNARVS